LGQVFRNPVGIAAGFDKNADHVEALAALGFGFVEIGSVTAQPSEGNPRPRLFRLPADGALINRMGLNNRGAAAAAARLAEAKRTVPIFVNIAKSHVPGLEGAAAIDDYVTSVREMSPVADVLVLNISCPNSGDGRTFEAPEALTALLSAVSDVRDNTPLLVKVSPDLDPVALDQVIEIAVAHGVDGFTATNTTVHREGLSASPEALSVIGPGGLSGAPLHARAVDTVRQIRARVELPIVGVGGIRGAAEAAAFLEAGANLIQLYTGFIYGGPTVVRQICAGLGQREEASTAETSAAV
jgi:dihydroorotate dehydrogenase